MLASWTSENDATLREMLAARRSFAEIGAALGVTRSSVAGRTKRLGLKSQRPAHRPRSTADKRAARDRYNKRRQAKRAKAREMREAQGLPVRRRRPSAPRPPTPPTPPAVVAPIAARKPGRIMASMSWRGL